MPARSLTLRLEEADRGDSNWKIDLAVGARTGLEVLKRVDPRKINCVIPSNDDLSSMALRLGFRTSKDFAGGDVLFSVHWPRLISASILESYELAINIHPGYLPRYRGMYPIFWALKEGGPVGVTVHEMIPQLDAGPIFWRELVDYSQNETGGDVWLRTSSLETGMAVELIGCLGEGQRPVSYPLDEELGVNRTVAHFVEARDFPPISEMTESEKHRLVRILTHPYYPLPAWARDEEL